MEKACSRHTQRQDVLHPPVLGNFRSAWGPPCWMVSFALGWRRQLTVVRKAFIIDATTKFDQKGP